MIRDYVTRSVGFFKCYNHARLIGGVDKFNCWRAAAAVHFILMFEVHLFKPKQLIANSIDTKLISIFFQAQWRHIFTVVQNFQTI